MRNFFPPIQQLKGFRVVLAGAEFSGRKALISLLEQNGLECVPARSLKEAEHLLAQRGTAIAICHATCEGCLSDFLRAVGGNRSSVPVIVCADFYEPRLYLDAMEQGAFDYLIQPYYREGVEWVIANALQRVLNSGDCASEPEETKFASASASGGGTNLQTFRADPSFAIG
jgi:DNA-binding NtrC family response regulator